VVTLPHRKLRAGPCIPILNTIYWRRRFISGLTIPPQRTPRWHDRSVLTSSGAGSFTRCVGQNEQRLSSSLDCFKRRGCFSDCGHRGDCRRHFLEEGSRLYREAPHSSFPFVRLHAFACSYAHPSPKHTTRRVLDFMKALMPNKSLMTNRRCQYPLHPESKTGAQFTLGLCALRRSHTLFR